MTELEEAEAWFATAKLGFDLEGASRARYTVVVAQCIHALIRGNDALSVHYLRRRSTRHEDAALLFGELVRQGKISAKYAALRLSWSARSRRNPNTTTKARLSAAILPPAGSGTRSDSWLPSGRSWTDSRRTIPNPGAVAPANRAR